MSNVVHVPRVAEETFFGHADVPQKQQGHLGIFYELKVFLMDDLSCPKLILIGKHSEHFLVIKFP